MKNFINSIYEILLTLCIWLDFFKMIKNVPGDIVECGIGRGRSLLIISAINEILDENEGGKRHIFGYDSFEGFPEPSEEDSSPRNPQKGEWSSSPSGKYQYTVDFIKKILIEGGSYSDDRITLVKGFFDDSLLHHPSRPIALLHIDADLYKSYATVLRLLYEKVSSGGIIIFDDFTSNSKVESFPGARQAVKEFLKDNFTNLQISLRGNYYYIKP
ncbi:TylF/MycF/NovP-related O-methyltransferase [Candidatus Nitrosotenuis uzonensis]|nr:TylF/MycF/NovP-related O-methyltransferase [Candidatus Nitrosotenuis uzonensis]